MKSKIYIFFIIAMWYIEENIHEENIDFTFHLAKSKIPIFFIIAICFQVLNWNFIPGSGYFINKLWVS